MKIILENMPYIDETISTVDQKRIAWIENGERLNGAKLRYGNDGVLNRPLLQIKQNTDVLERNLILAVSVINEQDVELSKLKEAMIDLGDENVVETIQRHTTEIEDHEERIIANEKLSLESNSISNDLLLRVGTRNATETIDREIYDDLFWIKSEIGQYDGQDINGEEIDGNIATGLKRRVMDCASEIVNVREELSDIVSGLGGSEAVQNVIAKINKNTESIETLNDKGAVYDNNFDKTNTEIESIKSKIDFTNTKTIGERVKTLETASTTYNNLLNDTNSGIVVRLDTLTEKTNTIEDSFDGINTDVLALKESNTNILLSISNIDKKIGADANPADGTIRKDILTLQTQLNTTASDGQDNFLEIGNLRTDLTAVTLRVTNVEKVSDTNKTDVSSLKTRMTTVETASTKSTNDLNALTPRVSTLETDNAKNKTDVSSLQTQVSALEEQIEMLVSRIETLEKANEPTGEI